MLLLLMSPAVVPLSTDATQPVALLVNALAVLLTCVGGNRARHRPSFAPVRSIGWVEAVAFVVAPTIALVVAPYSDVVVEDITVSAVELRLVAVLVIVSVQLLLLALVLVVVMSVSYTHLDVYKRQQQRGPDAEIHEPVHEAGEGGESVDRVLHEEPVDLSLIHI